MTEMLNSAVAKLASLPPEKQDRIARWLLQEFPDEELWDKRFSETKIHCHGWPLKPAVKGPQASPPELIPIACEVRRHSAFLDRLLRNAA